MISGTKLENMVGFAGWWRGPGTGWLGMTAARGPRLRAGGLPLLLHCPHAQDGQHHLGALTQHTHELQWPATALPANRQCPPRGAHRGSLKTRRAVFEIRLTICPIMNETVWEHEQKLYLYQTTLRNFDCVLNTSD